MPGIPPPAPPGEWLAWVAVAAPEATVRREALVALADGRLGGLASEGRGDNRRAGADVSQVAVGLSLCAALHDADADVRSAAVDIAAGLGLLAPLTLALDDAAAPVRARAAAAISAVNGGAQRQSAAAVAAAGWEGDKDAEGLAAVEGACAGVVALLRVVDRNLAHAATAAHKSDYEYGGRGGGGGGGEGAEEEAALASLSALGSLLQGLPHVPPFACGALLAAPMARGTRAVRGAAARLAAALGDSSSVASVALVDQVAVLRLQAVALLQERIDYVHSLYAL